VSFLGSDGGRSLFGIYTLLIKWNNYFMIWDVYFVIIQWYLS
jgi:hypothetical protein